MQFRTFSKSGMEGDGPTPFPPRLQRPADGGVVAGGSGVLPRLAGSTATGVSIRVTDEAGVPLRMGLSLPVTAYDKNTAGRTGSR